MQSYKITTAEFPPPCAALIKLTTHRHTQSTQFPCRTGLSAVWLRCLTLLVDLSSGLPGGLHRPVLLLKLCTGGWGTAAVVSLGNFTASPGGSPVVSAGLAEPLGCQMKWLMPLYLIFAGWNRGWFGSLMQNILLHSSIILPTMYPAV